MTKFAITTAALLASTAALAQSPPVIYIPAPKWTQQHVAALGTVEPESSNVIRPIKGIALIRRFEQPFTTIIVGDPTVVDVIALTNQSIQIEAKDFGITNLILLDANKQPIEQYKVDVGGDFMNVDRWNGKGTPNGGGSWTHDMITYSCWLNGCEHVGGKTITESKYPTLKIESNAPFTLAPNMGR
jgi:Flp pilus assembly secretin CpaC